MAEHSKPRPNPLATLLMATMLSTGEATGLGRWSPPGGWKPAYIEHDIDRVPTKKREQEYQAPAMVLPTFSGRIADLQDWDLDGTGHLVKAYAPKLFTPHEGSITITNLTPATARRSELLFTYEFQANRNPWAPAYDAYRIDAPREYKTGLRQFLPPSVQQLSTTTEPPARVLQPGVIVMPGPRPAPQVLSDLDRLADERQAFLLTTSRRSSKQETRASRTGSAAHSVTSKLSCASTCTTRSTDSERICARSSARWRPESTSASCSSRRNTRPAPSMPRN